MSVLWKVTRCNLRDNITVLEKHARPSSFLHCEDEARSFLRYFINYLPDKKASHSKRHKSTQLPREELKNLKTLAQWFVPMHMKIFKCPYMSSYVFLLSFYLVYHNQNSLSFEDFLTPFQLSESLSVELFICTSFYIYIYIYIYIYAWGKSLPEVVSTPACDMKQHKQKQQQKQRLCSRCAATVCEHI